MALQSNIYPINNLVYFRYMTLTEIIICVSLFNTSKLNEVLPTVKIN